MAIAQRDTRSIFANEEAGWARREGAHKGEDFVFRTYLDPQARTLEAGTGGGRLLLDLQSRGFTDLHGFDLMPEFIDIARRRDQSGAIDFRVLNATDLDYEDASFDQAIYLQQVLCFLQTDPDRRRAVDEAFRVLRPGGTLVTCLLAERWRRQSWRHRWLLRYFAGLRAITFRRLSTHYTSWLKLNGRINWRALLDRRPYLYWFDDAEAARLFEGAGFEIVAVGSDAQVKQQAFCPTVDDLARAEFYGGLYVVCRKPVHGLASAAPAQKPR